MRDYRVPCQQPIEPIRRGTWLTGHLSLIIPEGRFISGTSHAPTAPLRDHDQENMAMNVSRSPIPLHFFRAHGDLAKGKNV
jgi:hypothetical protein